jgi:hypothetical protein
MLAKLNRIVAGFRAALARGDAAPQAATGTALTVIPEPKVSNKQISQPSFAKRTKTASSDIKLTATDRSVANTDLTTLRTGTTTKQVIKDLSRVSPDLSGSVWAYQRMVVTRGFKGVAYNHDGTIEPDATAALQQVIARMQYFGDYTEGFSATATLHACAEALALELRINGSCSGELVLDKARLPSRIQPVSTTQLDFYEDKNHYVYPVQVANGELINLDIPTFFYEALDQDLTQAYSDSPMEAAVQPVIADQEFTNDVRRTIKRALHPRLTAIIDSELFKKTMPLDIQGDDTKMNEYRNAFITAVQDTVNGLEPDDALIAFDTIEFDYLNNGNVTLNKEWDTLQQMVNAKVATGAKAPPAVLGHGSGSQNVASTETMLFVRYCEGVQLKLNSFFSRAFTLAVRLLGYDVYVKFEFDRIDLRPDSELEAFRSMRQERILELLSFGFLSDEEAAIELVGHLPAKPLNLSGTMFAVNKVAQGSANGFSNTSNGQQQGAAGAAQSSDQPQSKKGPVTRVK